MGPVLVWIFQRREQSLAPAGIQTTIPWVATLLPSHYSDYAIPAYIPSYSYWKQATVKNFHYWMSTH
jgi:hypothetical protein